jgi:Rieske 2Fe-2S family protein
MALLDRLTASLPAAWYFDPAQYARELEAVWYRDWICVGRAEDLPGVGDYLVVPVGEESLILTRDREGRPRAFHNTCRHRGSTLCATSRGHFANGRIVCPYHAWTYGLGGELLATPRMDLPADFRRENYPLYAAHLDTWGGFLFVNLSDKPATTLQSFLGDEAENVRRWPLADLVSVHREVSTLACNWKIFWENYSECYHCPGIHPELCRVVPLYREGLIGHARVAPGFVTWTVDGQTKLPLIDGPSDADRALGAVFAIHRCASGLRAERAHRSSRTRAGGAHGRLAAATGRRRAARGRPREDVRTGPARRRPGWPRLRAQPAGTALPSPS